MTAAAETVPPLIVESFRRPPQSEDGEFLQPQRLEFESTELAAILSDRQARVREKLLLPTTMELSSWQPQGFNGDGFADIAHIIAVTGIGARAPKRLGDFRASILGYIIGGDCIRLEVFNEHNSIVDLDLRDSEANEDSMPCPVVGVTMRTYLPRMQVLRAAHEHMPGHPDVVKCLATRYIGQLITQATNPQRYSVGGCRDIEFEHPDLQELNARRIRLTDDRG